jgi:hydroxymethylbilane synthase
MKIRVAARPSPLSIKQVEIAMKFIKSRLPDLEYEIVKVKSKGDVIRDRPIYKIGSKGVFEKEVNLAVLRGEADIAVHSLKDLPSRIDPRLEIVLVPPRGSPYDALVPSRDRKLPQNISSLPSGSVVGTSSVRRSALLLHYNTEIVIKDIRGNVDTRLRKLDRGDYDYIVVAEVALERLGVKRPYYRLSLDEFPPSPGQGFIAVVALSDSEIAKKLRALNDKVNWNVMVAERSFLYHASAGCGTPLGGVAIPYGNGMLKFIGVVLSPDGRKAFWIKMRRELERAEELGREAGELVRSIYDKVVDGDL